MAGPFNDHQRCKLKNNPEAHSSGKEVTNIEPPLCEPKTRKEEQNYHFVSNHPPGKKKETMLVFLLKDAVTAKLPLPRSRNHGLLFLCILLWSTVMVRIADRYFSLELCRCFRRGSLTHAFSCYYNLITRQSTSQKNQSRRISSYPHPVTCNSPLLK